MTKQTNWPITARIYDPHLKLPESLQYRLETHCCWKHISILCQYSCEPQNNWECCLGKQLSLCEARTRTRCALGRCWSLKHSLWSHWRAGYSSGLLMLAHRLSWLKASRSHIRRLPNNWSEGYYIFYQMRCEQLTQRCQWTLVGIWWPNRGQYIEHYLFYTFSGQIWRCTPFSRTICSSFVHNHSSLENNRYSLLWSWLAVVLCRNWWSPEFRLGMSCVSKAVFPLRLLRMV